MLHVSRVINGHSIHIHILQIESLVPSYELRIETNDLIPSALARQWSFAGAPVPLFFRSLPNSSPVFSRVLVVRSKEKSAAGLDPSFLPKKCTSRTILLQDHGVLAYFQLFGIYITLFLNKTKYPTAKICETSTLQFAHHL